MRNAWAHEQARDSDRELPHNRWMTYADKRYAKRAQKAKDRALMMREYWQYEAALARELLELEMDYDDPFDSGYVYDAEMADYMEKEMEMDNDRYSDYDDYYDPYFDDPWDDYPRACSCPECRPDLYREPEQHGDVTFYPLKVQPQSLGDLLRSKLQ